MIFLIPKKKSPYKIGASFHANTVATACYRPQDWDDEEDGL